MYKENLEPKFQDEKQWLCILSSFAIEKPDYDLLACNVLVTLLLLAWAAKRRSAKFLSSN